MEFYSFSFLQGVLAFLAPCAVALLPGYIIAFISRSDNNPAISTRLLRGLKLAMLSIAGIFSIYAVATILIISAAQLLKDYMIWVTIGMGVILIIIGILMVAGKSFSFTLNVNHASPDSEIAEAFVFGIAYAIGALGCLFPLFLVVATQAMAAPSPWTGAGYFAAYFGGMSLMMIGAILLSVLARDFMMKYLRKILPYMEIVTGWLLIVAGGYVIYYQSFLMY
jgi:cytochrome c-type biogenesis protein